jgi:hypothetical protein
MDIIKEQDGCIILPYSTLTKIEYDNLVATFE